MVRRSSDHRLRSTSRLAPPAPAIPCPQAHPLAPTPSRPNSTAPTTSKAPPTPVALWSSVLRIPRLRPLALRPRSTSTRSRFLSPLSSPAPPGSSTRDRAFHESSVVRRSSDRRSRSPSRQAPPAPAIPCPRGHPLAPTPSRPNSAAPTTSTASPTPATICSSVMRFPRLPPQAAFGHFQRRQPSWFPSPPPSPARLGSSTGTETFTILSGTTVVDRRSRSPSRQAPPAPAIPCPLGHPLAPTPSRPNSPAPTTSAASPTPATLWSSILQFPRLPLPAFGFVQRRHTSRFLTANITSPAGVVAGTGVTIYDDSTPIGSPVIVNVSAGAASASYSLPAGTPAGTYAIKAVYSGTNNFLGFSDTGHTLVISAAASATAAASASATFNVSALTVPLTATITSPAGVVNEGTETFTILSWKVRRSSDRRSGQRLGSARQRRLFPAPQEHHFGISTRSRPNSAAPPTSAAPPSPATHWSSIT